MGRINLYYKVLNNFLHRNIVTPADIESSYDYVAEGYNEQFLNIMQKYNVKMLSLLQLPDRARVLDLACGTGFNTEWLLRLHPDYIIDGVDISKGMLEQAHIRLGGKVNLFRNSMLQFLKDCKDERYDIIVCGWALKYQPPVEVLRECKRVLRPGGQIAVILNTRQTLPEIRRIYKYLLIENSQKIKKLMLELPNPKDERHLEKWFRKAGFGKINAYRGLHKFSFNSSAEMVDWVTSTGALAGFDIMVDLHDRVIKEQISHLFDNFSITTITHDFVWGAAKKC